MSTTHETIAADCNVRMQIFRADALEDAFGEPEDIVPYGREDRDLWAGRALSGDVEPEVVWETHNKTLVGLHAYLAQNLARGDTANMALTRLSVGTGNSEAAVVPTNATALANEIGRVSVSASEVQNGTELYTSTYIGTNEFNEQTLTEIGLRLSNGVLANRASLPPTPKTNVIGLTIEVIISFSNP